MRRSIALLAAALLWGSQAAAQDWPNWRGPNHDGSTSGKDLPVEFDKSKGVRWAAPLPGPGAGTPIVFGDRVYVTSIEPDLGKLLALAFQRETGELLWERDAGSGYQPAGDGTKTSLSTRSNYASPSPVTDGKRVVFFYGNGDLVAFDPKGKELWKRNLQEDHGIFTFQWTFSASPTLWDDRLHLQVLQRDEPVNNRGEAGNASFLLALNPDTGETLFKEVRPSEAQRESLESYATPLPYESDGQKELLVVGGDVITGHDPSTGKELWRWGTWNEGHREQWWRIVPTAVVGGGNVLVCAPKKAPVYAIRLGGEGELGDDGLAWRSEGRPNPVSSDVPTPLFYEDRFYVLSDVRDALSRVDPADGEVEWTIEMPGKSRWRASPTGADGKIYCMNHAGEVVIVDPKDGSILNTVAMGEEDDDNVRSTIAVAYDNLFIRTNTTLYCIGE